MPDRTPSRGPRRPSRHAPKGKPAAAPVPSRTKSKPRPAGDASEKHAPREIWLPGAIRVVHKDEHLIVVDKPAGLLSVAPPDHASRNVFDEVKAHVRDRARKRGTRVWVIHRLDKEVSGLMVFAKTEKAYMVLKEEFRARRVHRLYAAVVEGEMRPDIPASSTPEATTGRRLAATRQAHAGSIQSFLYEDARGLVHTCDSPAKAPRGSFEPESDDTPARLAVTHWQVQRVGSGRTMLQVRLETGRKHQIRAHLASIKRPIVGDRRYGAATDPLSRVCLHAFELGFAHPATGESVRYRSPTPGSFFGLVEESPRRREMHGHDGAPVEHPPDAAPSPAPPRTSPPTPVAAHASPTSSSWDHVAEWYDDLLEDRGSDHHENVILPGTLRLLALQPGQRLLDVACGQGVLCRRLAAQGVQCTGVDASPKLVQAAQRAGGGEFVVGDARDLGRVVQGPFDAAACVMALMNIEPVSSVLQSIANLLAPGGRFVAVILHPAFRAPGQTSWEWDSSPARPGRVTKPPTPKQFRRVDGYLSLGQREIVMNPGAAAHGKDAVTTITYHRPIQHYVKSFAQAGLLLDALEEWASLRTSQPGPRAAEENRARREIPMFLALRALKPGA